MGEEGKPLLSLENFDAPDNIDSRYILTSPVSLRACARLGIKPVELLPKAFSDFKLSFNEEPVSKVQDAFMEYEEQRKSKLATARRLRERMKDIERGLLLGQLDHTYRPVAVTRGSSVRARKESKNFSRHVSKERAISSDRWQSAVRGSRGSYPESPRRPPSAKQPEKKVKSRAATPKKDTAEGLDPFQKQLQERLQALESMDLFLRSEKKEKMEERLRKAERQKELQGHLKEQRMKERYLHEELKKKCQLLNRRHLEEQQFIRSHLLCQQRTEVDTLAACKREILTRQRAQGATRKNQEKRARFECQRLRQVVQASVAQQSLEEDLTKRHQLARDRLEQEMVVREARIQDTVKKREEQSEHCRFTAQHIEQCLQQWREEVDAHTKHAGQTAQLAAKRSVERKKSHISRVCKEKVMEHTLNLALLAEHEREKLESYQQEIEHWQKKKQELSRRKQEENNKSKAITSYSSMLRDLLKDNVSFADKSRAVEPRSRLEAMPQRPRHFNSLHNSQF